MSSKWYSVSGIDVQYKKFHVYVLLGTDVLQKLKVIIDTNNLTMTCHIDRGKLLFNWLI